eukprot:1372403-Prymnesium_polylepis.1
MLSCSSDPHCTASSRSTNEICSTGLEACLTETQYHQLKMDCDSPGARAYYVQRRQPKWEACKAA